MRLWCIQQWFFFLLPFVVLECMRVSSVLRMSSASLIIAPSSRATALVTGSTDGIGVTTAKNLAAAGYNVLIHGRDEKRIENALRTVESFASGRTDTPGTAFALPPADLSTVDGSMRLATSVVDAVKRYDLELSVVMNNAGVFSERRVVTEDGLELTFAVNVVAAFVVTSMLLPVLLLKRQSNSSEHGGSRRIVIASSISQCQSVRDWDDLATFSRRRYSAHAAYSESKLLDAMLTVEMASRLQEAAGVGTDRITCNCLDPGTVNTKMLLAGWGPCGIDVRDALDQTWLCSSEEVRDVTGKYFIHQCETSASLSAYDPIERNKLWSILTNVAPEAASMWDFK